MSRPLSLPAFLVSLFLVLLFLGLSTNALPLDVERSSSPLVLRQNRPNGPTTAETVSTSQTVAGQMVQTCTITLTPIVDANGKAEVVEVESCTVTVSNNSTSASTPPPPPPNLPPASASSSTSSSTTTTGATSATTTSSSTTNNNTATPPPPPAGAATTTGSTTTSPLSSSTNTEPVAASTPTPPSGAGTATTTTSSTTSATSTSASSSGTIAPINAATSAVSANGFTTVQSVPTPAPGLPDNAPTVSASASNDGNSAIPSAAAAAASPSSSSQTTFTLPGKKLSVLPIGLAVFAGISVIALIVVGLVTYERTKYRKAFRQRKLAEAGTTVGYGGMTQSP